MILEAIVDYEGEKRGKCNSLEAQGCEAYCKCCRFWFDVGR